MRAPLLGSVALAALCGCAPAGQDRVAVDPAAADGSAADHIRAESNAAAEQQDECRDMTEIRVAPEFQDEGEVRESTRVSIHLPAPDQPVEEISFQSFGTVRISDWGGGLDTAPQLVEGRYPPGRYPLTMGFWLEIEIEADRAPTELTVDRLTVLDADGTPLWTFDPRYTDGDVFEPFQWERQESGAFRFAPVRVVSGPVDELRDLPRGGRVYVAARSNGSPWRHRKVAIVIRVCLDGDCQLLRSEFDDRIVPIS